MSPMHRRRLSPTIMSQVGLCPVEFGLAEGCKESQPIRCLGFTVCLSSEISVVIFACRETFPFIIFYFLILVILLLY